MSHDANKYRVYAALKGHELTQAQLADVTGLGVATVHRWLKVLMEEDRVHVFAFVAHPHGGPDAAVYSYGPKPPNLRVVKRTPPDAKTRTKNHRKRLRESGEWEHHLAMKRAKYRADNPKRDPLTAAFFKEPPCRCEP